MKISFKSWLFFGALSVVCLTLWFHFSYPRIVFVDLSLDKKEAFAQAQSYLVSCGADSKDYVSAVVFSSDTWADRYLQRTLGFKQENEFLSREKCEIFSWYIRFFKELKKEEYAFRISPKNGAILEFWHKIDDVEARQDYGKEESRFFAEQFLQQVARINPAEYDFHKEEVKRYDSRTDYIFSWEKKGVYIPWIKDGGGAKLLVGVTVSGKEIREFYLNELDIPDKFERHILNQLFFGSVLHSVYLLLLIVLVISSFSIFIKRKHTALIQRAKHLYLALGFFLIAIEFIQLINSLQEALIRYPTMTRLTSFLWLLGMSWFGAALFLIFIFLTPGIAGESLLYQEASQARYRSLLHYRNSTFFSRQVSGGIFLGYLVFFIMLGLQAAVFFFGQKYAGAWEEWTLLTQFSSMYVPFFGAFFIGLTASFSEEVMFRLFGITWLRRYLKNVFLTIIVSSAAWGLAHTTYAIFPAWFRAVEVGVLGILLGFVFLRYGIIPVLVAHYLFNVFWSISAYILGRSNPFLFSGSVITLVIPLIFAVIAYIINKKDIEREMSVFLDSTQRYNLDILKIYIVSKKSAGASVEQIKEELIGHNWDPDLVRAAFREAFGRE